MQESSHTDSPLVVNLMKWMRIMSQIWNMPQQKTIETKISVTEWTAKERDIIQFCVAMLEECSHKNYVIYDYILPT